MGDSGPARTNVIMLPACQFFADLGYGFGLTSYTITSHPDKRGLMRGIWSRISAQEILKEKISMRETESRHFCEEESACLRKLEHPNVLGCLAPLEALLTSPHFLQHYTTLKTLVYERLNSADPFPSSDVDKVARDLAFALEYLHNEVSYLHGDVQSGNVIVQGNFERVVLADFRVALKLDDDLTAPVAHYHATKAWCPKEVLKKREVKVCHKAEMYAYGLTLYEMLALEFPHLDAALSDDRLDQDGYDSDDLDSRPPPFLLPGGGPVQVEVLEEYALFTRLGSRPQIPWVYADIYLQNPDYHPAVTAFYLCTTAGLRGRPSAAHMASFFRQHDGGSCSTSD